LNESLAVALARVVGIERRVLSHRMDVAEVPLKRAALVKGSCTASPKEPEDRVAARVDDERGVVHDPLGDPRS
jgi:hypothetical protein